MQHQDFVTINITNELDDPVGNDQLDLVFFDAAAKSTIEEIDDQMFQQKYKQVKSAVNFLFFGWNSDSEEAVQPLKKFIFERDPEFSRAFRLAFNEGFINLYHQIRQYEHFNERQRERIELFISNALSFLVMGDLNEKEIIQIPQWIEHEWILVNYQVIPIELTPTTGIAASFLTEDLRVYAYGLQPINWAEKARSRLIFMGTHYPAGPGFWTQLITDLQPFETPGEALYQSGRRNIVNWLNQQRTKVHVCGISLGGALSLRLSMDYGEKLYRVDALNPPGLHKKPDIRFVPYKDLKIVIQCNEKDLVPELGYWQPFWTMYKVSLPPNKQPRGFISPHAMSFVGLSRAKFERIDPTAKNNTNFLWNFLVYQLLRFIVYISVWPIAYILRPLWMLCVSTFRNLALFFGKKPSHTPMFHLNQSLSLDKYRKTDQATMSENISADSEKVQSSKNYTL